MDVWARNNTIHSGQNFLGWRLVSPDVGKSSTFGVNWSNADTLLWYEILKWLELRYPPIEFSIAMVEPKHFRKVYFRPIIRETASMERLRLSIEILRRVRSLFGIQYKCTLSFAHHHPIQSRCTLRMYHRFWLWAINHFQVHHWPRIHRQNCR